MNFRILKEIIVNLKQKIKCESCRKRFANREINIEDTSGNKATIICSCSRCGVQTIIDVSLLTPEEISELGRDHQGLQVRAETKSNISQDDILDIKNFLKDFSGNFKQIFKN